jgi:hypothetical protein
MVVIYGQMRKFEEVGSKNCRWQEAHFLPHFFATRNSKIQKYKTGDGQQKPTVWMDMVVKTTTNHVFIWISSCECEF